jgi:hypothetical protein
MQGDSMMPVPVVDVAFNGWEKVFSLVGTVAASIIAAVGFVAKRWTNMEDAILEQEKRLTKIEDSYVSREDLHEVMDDLQRDVNNGFTRAHQRMDQLFSRLGHNNNCHGQEHD